MLGAVILASLGEILREALANYPEIAGSRMLLFGIILVLLMRFRPLWFDVQKKHKHYITRSLKISIISTHSPMLHK